MKFFGRKQVTGIARDTLEFMFEVSRDTHPDEFTGLLRTTDVSELDVGSESNVSEGLVITDVLIVPEAESGDVLSVLGVDLLPRNTGSVGTVRSDPDGDLSPTQEDVSTFSRQGRIHMIIGEPYDESSWKAYDSDAVETELPVVDVEFGDEDEDFASKSGLFR